jgi:hypothetical protein
VYDATGRPVIDALLDGYNGTIFAYGQTGSGKTHCMFGPTPALVYQAAEAQGIVPRAVQHIFNHIHDGIDGTEFVLRCSLFEVYREQLRDLLDPANANLRIKETPRQGVFVDGLAQEFVACVDDVVRIIRGGSRLRAVAATRLNQHSSRSHVIFSLTCEQHLEDGTEKLAKLNLVDLAGSEKVWKSSSSGVTLEEAKKINWSLSALGNVINALAARQSHVPYRNSKLTRIIQETLGGNFKTALVTTCSPLRKHMDETVSSLQFATRAKAVCNHVKVNFVYSAEQLMSIVETLQEELLTTRREVATRTGGPIPSTILQACSNEAQHRAPKTLRRAPHTKRLLQWDATLLDESCESTGGASPAVGSRECRASSLSSVAAKTKVVLQKSLSDLDQLMLTLTTEPGFGAFRELRGESTFADSRRPSVGSETAIEPLERLKAQQLALHEALKEQKLKREFEQQRMRRREVEGLCGILNSYRHYLDQECAKVAELQNVPQGASLDVRTSPGSSRQHSPRDKRPCNDCPGGARGEIASATTAAQKDGTNCARKEPRRHSHSMQCSKEPNKRLPDAAKSPVSAHRRNSTPSGNEDIVHARDKIEALKLEHDMLSLDFERETQMHHMILMKANEYWRERMQRAADKVLYWDQCESQTISEEQRLEKIMAQRREELLRVQERVAAQKMKVRSQEHHLISIGSVLEQQAEETSRVSAAEDLASQTKCKLFDGGVTEYRLLRSGLFASGKSEVPWARQGA